MLITLTGENAYLLRHEVNSLKQDFLKSNYPLGLNEIEGYKLKIPDLMGALTSSPMFSKQSLIILDQPSLEPRFVEKIEDVIEKVGDKDLVIIEPKLDKRSVYYKTLKSKTDFREFQIETNTQTLSTWISAQAKTRGGNISSADARYLVERIGNDQNLLSNELDKLINYNENITRTSIDELTVKNSNGTVFDLLDCLFKKDKLKTFTIYDELLLSGTDVQAIIALLTWQLNILAIIKAGKGKTPQEVAKESKNSPFVINKSYKLARSIEFTDLRKFIEELISVDRFLKTYKSDPKEILGNYFLKILS